MRLAACTVIWIKFSDGKVRFSSVLCLFWPNREPDCRFSSGDLPNPDQNLGSGFTRSGLVWSQSVVYTTKHMTWSRTVTAVVVVLVVVVVVGIVVVVVIPWSCRPPRSVQYRMWVRGDRGRVCVEGRNPRVDAARSGREMERYTKPAGLGAKAAHECGSHHPFTLAKVTAVVDGMLLTAVQAAAERAVSANAARGCGEVGEENGGLHGVPLGWVVAGGRKWSRTLPRGTKLRIGGRLYQEHVMFESLRMHTNATCWGTWVRFRILLNREWNHRSSSAKIAEPDPQLASGPDDDSNSKSQDGDNDDARGQSSVLMPHAPPVTAQPGRDPHNNQKYVQDDPRWDREVRGATAVLERLLESWEQAPHAEDHVQVGHAIRVIGRHVTLAHDLPRTVQKSLDELAPRLKLEFIADASYLIIIAFIIVIALVGHALRITLAVAYRILKMFKHVQQQQTGK
ncbi:hypothetical protein EDB89DRAFT_1916598 [Lactarius sanguifluus]|nr:hypothetical protein EDB89DRAFT_1916598 [Lactarius sanguifluus]